MGRFRTRPFVTGVLLLCGLAGLTSFLADAQSAPPPNPEDVRISTQWSLDVDADGDGHPNAGNALSYTVRIHNGTEAHVQDATLTTLLDPHLQLMQGSVEVSKGIVTSGNRLGDHRLIVDVLRIGPNASVEVRFQAVIKSPLPVSVDQVCSQSWLTFVINVDPKIADTTCTPIVRQVEQAIGGDPPIHGTIQVFPTSESAVGQDLTGNGKIHEVALRYRDLTTGRIINTGLETSGHHADMDVYEGVIAFVGANDQIRLYDTATGDVTDVGSRGTHPVINRQWVVFEKSGWVHYYNRITGTLTDPRIPGKDPVVYGSRIVYSWGNPATIRYIDLDASRLVDTGIVGTHPAIFGDHVAFVTLETDVQEDLNHSGYVDSIGVIRTYNLTTETVVNTGAIGRYPVLWDGLVAFSTREMAARSDLNGDGQILGEVIRYFDLRAAEVVNTRQLGTEPDIYEDKISFYNWEKWNRQGQDANADGDTLDPVVDIHTIPFSRFVAPEDTESAPSSWSGRASMRVLDVNGNGVIDDAEFFSVIDRWTSGAIGDDRFLAVLDAWVHETMLSDGESAPLAQSTPSVSLASDPTGRITFYAEGARVTEIGVTVYDLSGDRIFQAQSVGWQLGWQLQDDQGLPVANGVYLYRVTTLGPHGHVTRSDVRRLIVLR